MVRRLQYRAAMSDELDDKILETLLKKDEERVSKAIEDGLVQSVSMYRHDNMLFLYVETTDETFRPIRIFPAVTHHLELWPQKEGPAYWAHMYNLSGVSESAQLCLDKSGRKQGRGSVAFLNEDEIFDRISSLRAAETSGSDENRTISLHENILFSYHEESEESSVSDAMLECFFPVEELFSLGMADNR